MHAGKTYNCSLQLGQEFTEVASFQDFKETTTTFPWIRAAAMACNLSSPLAKDGIGRLLSKADFEKLRNPKDKAMLVQAEKQLHLNHALLQAQNLDQSTGGQACMARAMIRTMLLLTKRQAKGREKHQYQDLAEIATAFGQEFEMLVQQPEGASTSREPASSSGPAPAATEPANLEDNVFGNAWPLKNVDSSFPCTLRLLISQLMRLVYP